MDDLNSRLHDLLEELEKKEIFISQIGIHFVKQLYNKNSLFYNPTIEPYTWDEYFKAKKSDTLFNLDNVRKIIDDIKLLYIKTNIYNRTSTQGMKHELEYYRQYNLKRYKENNNVIEGELIISMILAGYEYKICDSSDYRNNCIKFKCKREVKIQTIDY
jgi:hypothetical protein